MSGTNKESRVENIIRKLDGNGAQVGFRLRGESQNRSIIGAIFSILSLFASIALSFPIFLNFVNLLEPKISVGTEFSEVKQNSTTTAINFSDSSLYLSLSFFAPNRNSSVNQLSENNYTYVQYINKLQIQCTTCAENNKNSIMNLCNRKEFDKIDLKAMSKFKSNQVLNIFRNFSFCFPNYLTGSIMDVENTEQVSGETSQDSSLTLVIPFSLKTLSESNIETNSITRADSVNLQISNSIGSGTKQQSSSSAGAVENNLITSPSSPSNSAPLNQNNNTNPSGSVSNPTNIKPQPSTNNQPLPQPGTSTGSQQQPPLQPSNNNQPLPQPGTSTGSQQQPSQQPSTNTQPVQQPGTSTSPLQQPSQQPSTNTQPVQQPGTSTSPQQQPSQQPIKSSTGTQTQTQPQSPTGTQQQTQPQSPTGTPTQAQMGPAPQPGTQPRPPGRILRDAELKILELDSSIKNDSEEFGEIGLNNFHFDKQELDLILATPNNSAVQDMISYEDSGIELIPNSNEKNKKFNSNSNSKTTNNNIYTYNNAAERIIPYNKSSSYRINLNQANPEDNNNQIFPNSKPKHKNIKSFPQKRLLQTPPPPPPKEQQSLEMDALMIEKINRFRFPKILFINRSFQINPNAKLLQGEPLYENIFNLEILDYRDLLTGNPKSYNVFIQETILEITKPLYFFSSTTEKKKILKIFSIEENQLSQNLNEGAIFSFKAVGEIPKISITFVLFTDWLSAFGSFSTVFALISTILGNIYNDVLLNTNILNTLFKFIDNNEEQFKKELFGHTGSFSAFYDEKQKQKIHQKYKSLEAYDKKKKRSDSKKLQMKSKKQKEEKDKNKDNGNDYFNNDDDGNYYAKNKSKNNVDLNTLSKDDLALIYNNDFINLDFEKNDLSNKKNKAENAFNYMNPKGYHHEKPYDSHKNLIDPCEVELQNFETAKALKQTKNGESEKFENEKDENTNNYFNNKTKNLNSIDLKISNNFNNKENKEIYTSKEFNEKNDFSEINKEKKSVSLQNMQLSKVPPSLNLNHMSNAVNGFEKSSANLELVKKFNGLAPMENICFINKKTEGNTGVCDGKEENEKEKYEKIAIEEKNEIMIEDKTQLLNFKASARPFIKNSSLNEKILLIEKVNKIKNKSKNRFYFNTRKAWYYSTFKCCKKYLNKNKLEILIKTNEILKKNMEITHVIKKNLEFDFLKKLILTNKEFYLFPYQFKYINVGNMSATMSHLRYLNDISKEKFDRLPGDIQEKEASNNGEHEIAGNQQMILKKLITDYKNYFNF